MLVSRARVARLGEDRAPRRGAGGRLEAPEAGEVGELVVRGLRVGRFEIEPPTLISQPNDRTLEGSFSSVSLPIFASKY